MRGSSMTVLEDSAYSQMLVDWGQYIAHDISFTPQSSSRSVFSSGRDCLHTCSNAEPCFPMQVTSQQCFKVTFSRARQCWESCSFLKYSMRHATNSLVMIHINSQIQFIIDFASVAQIMLDDSILLLVSDGVILSFLCCYSINIWISIYFYIFSFHFRFSFSNFVTP